MRTRRSYLLRNSSTLNSYYHFQNSLCTSNLILSISCLWWQQLGTCRHLIATWILLMFHWKDSTSIGSLRKSKMNNNLLEKPWIHCSWKLHHPFVHLRLFLSMIALVVLFLFQLSLLELSDFSALELPWEVMTVDCSEFLEPVNQKKMQMQSTACFTWPKTWLLFYNICRLLSTKNFLWWDRSWWPFVTFKLQAQMIEVQNANWHTISQQIVTFRHVIHEMRNCDQLLFTRLQINLNFDTVTSLLTLSYSNVKSYRSFFCISFKSPQQDSSSIWQVYSDLFTGSFLIETSA